MSNTAPETATIMLDLVRSSIEHGLHHGSPAMAELKTLPPSLQEPGGCFVTLEINHQLRGCIGSLEAHRPLAEDLVANGYAAAFQDPRFPPLSEGEYPQTTIKISLLTPATPMQFSSEEDLLSQIRPGVDGLILSDRGHRGTFLPSVWEQLPTPQLFLNHLKQKAGLPGNYWSDTIRIERYQTEQIA